MEELTGTDRERQGTTGNDTKGLGEFLGETKRTVIMTFSIKKHCFLFFVIRYPCSEAIFCKKLFFSLFLKRKASRIHLDCSIESAPQIDCDLKPKQVCVKKGGMFFSIKRFGSNCLSTRWRHRVIFPFLNYKGISSQAIEIFCASCNLSRGFLTTSIFYCALGCTVLKLSVQLSWKSRVN